MEAKGSGGPDGFRLVRADLDRAAHDPAALLQRLSHQALPEDSSNLQKSANLYQVEPALETAINMALAVGAPLLITGEPGTGKTQAAYYLGWYFGIEVHPFHVQSISTARDLRYEFDAVAYLHWAQQGDSKEVSRENFLRRRPLWSAYDSTDVAIVLIDEIDKAPRDFPNDLLHELDQHSFPHPFREGDFVRPKAPRPPIVVITSNAERQLPSAFLRRCIHHHVVVNRAFVRRVIEAHRPTKFLQLGEGVQARALDLFEEIRRKPLRHRPGIAELLHWLAVLSAMRVPAEDLGRLHPELPGLSTMIKDPKDLEGL